MIKRTIKRNKILYICCILVSLSYLPGLVPDINLFAAPILITDNRIENLNGFPTLGRGYSIHSNRLHSVCFKKIVTTKPTFDFNYELKEVTDKFFREVPKSGEDRLANSSINSFVRKYYNTSEQEGTTTYTLKNVIVKLEIKSYYYSIDETQSPLSDNIKEVIKNKSYITFFNSCGHHYIRAVGRFSTYIALLQYRQVGDAKIDQEFSVLLEKGLFNFHGKKKISNEFTNNAVFRGLRVFVQGIGLSKGNLVNLVPLDIDQFRTTIQDAVRLMQDPNSGIINSLEVVPWTENPELTDHLSRGTKEKGGQEFIRQQRLEENSGIITEMNSTSHKQLEHFYTAVMCQKLLFKNYVDEVGKDYYDFLLGIKRKKIKAFTFADLFSHKVRKYDIDSTMFYNLVDENNKYQYVSLREFISYFAKNPPNNIFLKNKAYLYGKNPKGSGALDCINKLYKRGIDKVDYRNIPSCLKSIAYSTRISEDNFVEQYCLPKPVSLIFRKTKREIDIENARKKREQERRERKRRELEKKNKLKEAKEKGIVEEKDKEKGTKEKPKSLKEIK